MQINHEIIQKKLKAKGWSQNELARRMNIPKGTLSNVLSGRRGAGRKVISGLLRAFPEEKLENLILSKSIKTKKGR
ncbi:helix-turn-helix domain-containing protein [Paramaledivibacter caminithermalis]|jgi:transcriptional regulator with XRE-family HTH domain|uniref:Helix-turn-helix n=1 Tax=Paramaledivibacter caminithermalis (strain DSM 15212 / CIP 107654 / DViRD3) TaxID=1121301 RepID=A0A1M6M205_PARC5|nr:helix-turn-helix transcriptional regulator [Paramaledivibacter caminithermalis]SHJ77410.1 Helix-turn-helix [Paramaledivibacter caminithermalis DSM 15212]